MIIAHHNMCNRTLPFLIILQTNPKKFGQSLGHRKFSNCWACLTFRWACKLDFLMKILSWWENLSFWWAHVSLGFLNSVQAWCLILQILGICLIYKIYLQLEVGALPKQQQQWDEISYNWYDHDCSKNYCQVTQHKFGLRGKLLAMIMTHCPLPMPRFSHARHFFFFLGRWSTIFK